MRENKARRNDFKSGDWPLERIKAYTTQELRKLSVAVSVIRKSAFDDGIRLRRLDGAGNLSAGMVRKYKVMRHYKGLMTKFNAGEEQLIGYRTDFGGRIELIQRGFHEGGVVNKYDEKSSYPHKCLIQPSMIGGVWEKLEYGEFGWADIENASPLSMVQIRWAFPERYVDEHGVLQIVPWYALPYRLEGGGIRFFSKGWGWYRRDDAVLLKRWLETFAKLGACVHEDGSPFKMSKGEMQRLGAAVPYCMVDLIEVRLFHPANDERPFGFVSEVFERRKRTLARIPTGRYDISEKVDKLGLNGLSGKVAQSIGGSATKPPGSYNVHYASAIRAGTRRAIGEAALQAPHEIVQFCTDAVFSKVPLNLNEGKELGQWERDEVKGLLTVQSGVYSYTKAGKITNMSRGYMAGSVDLDDIEKRLEQEGVPQKIRKMVAFREALLTKVPNAWRQEVVNPDGTINKASQSIELVLRTFMTAGSAVASRDRFDLIGRWANVPKKMKVHTPGPKRRLLDADDFEGPGAAEQAARLYSTVGGEDGRRCHELVPTAPAQPEGNTWGIMSRPHIPTWYEGAAELMNDWEAEMDHESEEIAAGDQ